jgi:hypothetical protein
MLVVNTRQTANSRPIANNLWTSMRETRRSKALSTKSGIAAISRDCVASEGEPASIQEVQGHGSGTAKIA